MAKKMSKKMAKLPKMGGKDGARPSVKKQVPATLAANKVGGKGLGRAGRIAKMEKSDMAC